jgi:type II secretory pathway pseudopilin PulG
MSIAQRPCLRRAEKGSTLVEALVATLVLTTGLLAMAELVAIATSSNTRARRNTLAAIFATQKLEELRSLTWAFDVNGSPASDAALQPSPWSLQRNTSGFVDHVTQAGVVVGRDAQAPPTAAYTRRWSIEPLAASPEDAVLIQVLVTRTSDRGLADRGAVGRLPGDARLVTIKARKAR